MDRILRIQLLGDFHLSYGDEPVTTVDTPRLHSFLAYLLLHQESPQSRQRLSFQFWPDSNESQARTNLRNLLFRLREGFPDVDQFLEVDSKTIWWKPGGPYQLDVDEFKQMLLLAEDAEKKENTGEYQELLQNAVDVYKGDLLPNCYDDWIFPEREELSQDFLRALEKLITLLEKEPNYIEAVEYAQRLLRHDELHEAAYRTLMRLHALNGDRARALRTYHVCADILEKELGMDTSLPTRDLYEQLLDRDLPAKTPTRAAGRESPLVGRDQAWGEVQKAWRKSNEKPCFALIKGEAGIGKTRLAEEFLRWARKQGVTAAKARSYPAEGDHAYTPVIALLRSESFQEKLAQLENVWLTEIARLLPELRVDLPDIPDPERLPESLKRQRMFEACAQAVFRDEGSLVLVIDDLQWCDHETLDWFRFLIEYDSETKLLILATLRSEDLEPDDQLASVLSEMRRVGCLREIELNRLDQTNTLSLAANISSGEIDDQFAIRLYQETEGNPLFVVETVRSWLSDAGGGKHHRPTVPPKIQAVIETRLSALSPEARELADLAAVAGREVNIDLLDQATTRNEEEVVQGLDELWQRRVIRDQGSDGYDFSHEKFREVIYQTLSPPRRTHLHQKIANALEITYQDRTAEVASLLANHCKKAGRQEKAFHYYIEAGDLARQVYAMEDAIDFYQRALEIKLDPEVALEIRLFEGLGEALLSETRYEQAMSAYRSMHEAAVKAENICAGARSWLGLCKVQERLGKHQEAFDSAEQAVKAAESAGTEGLLASAILEKGAAMYRMGEAKKALSLGEKALDLSRKVKDHFLQARSLNLLGQINDMLGKYQESQVYKEEALSIFEEVNDHRARWWTRSVLLNMANTISLTGNYQRAIELYQEALDTEVDVSDPDWEWICLFNIAWSRIELGEFAKAEVILREILVKAISSGWFGLSMTNAYLANACLKQGRLEDALPAAKEAVLLAQESGAKEFLGAAWRILGKVAAQMDHPINIGNEEVDVRDCFTNSLEIFEEIQAEPEKARTLRSWGRYEMSKGDRRRGRSMWEEARGIFNQLGVTAEVEAMDQEMGSDLLI